MVNTPSKRSKHDPVATSQIATRLYSIVSKKVSFGENENLVICYSEQENGRLPETAQTREKSGCLVCRYT